MAKLSPSCCIVCVTAAVVGIGPAKKTDISIDMALALSQWQNRRRSTYSVVYLFMRPDQIVVCHHLSLFGLMTIRPSAPSCNDDARSQGTTVVFQACIAASDRSE